MDVWRKKRSRHIYQLTIGYLSIQNNLFYRSNISKKRNWFSVSLITIKGFYPEKFQRNRRFSVVNCFHYIAFMTDLTELQMHVCLSKVFQNILRNCKAPWEQFETRLSFCTGNKKKLPPLSNQCSLCIPRWSIRKSRVFKEYIARKHWPEMN